MPIQLVCSPQRWLTHLLKSALKASWAQNGVVPFNGPLEGETALMDYYRYYCGSGPGPFY